MILTILLTLVSTRGPGKRILYQKEPFLILSLAVPINRKQWGVGKIHIRMPVILFKEDENAWLNPDSAERNGYYR
jgi:hypothetical protein